jgi:hypothetical protein
MTPICRYAYSINHEQLRCGHPATNFFYCSRDGALCYCEFHRGVILDATAREISLDIFLVYQVMKS